VAQFLGGRSGQYDVADGTHSFLYDGTNWIIIDKPGATRTFINGIDGSNIVGYYQDTSGLHGFLYTIPEPATLLLLGLGALIAVNRR
jgi:hypothetical protein